MYNHPFTWFKFGFGKGSRICSHNPNNGDNVLLRWHKVMALKVDNVRLALDSAINDFIWRPYVHYADKCEVFLSK